MVSVEVSSSGDSGSLIGSLYGVASGGLDYDTPLRDSGLVRTMTGSYPWKVTNDFTTIVYITNISDQQAEFIGEVNYHGGHVAIDPRKLEPGETAVFDMEKFRNEKSTDAAGNQIPLSAGLGQFKWTVKGITNGKLLLMGRAEMASNREKISTSYSCNDPCPPVIGGSIDPFIPPIIIVNNSKITSSWTYAYYGNGFVSGPFSAQADWSTDPTYMGLNPTPTHTTTMTGTLPGGVCVSAYMGQEESYGWDGLNCYDNNNAYPVSDSGCSEVTDVKIVQNGSTDVTDETQNAIVGQQIALSVQVEGTQEQASSIEWSIPGTRVGGFTASSSSGTVGQLNLQNISQTFYWVDGGDNRQVGLTCRVGTEQFSKHTTFNVKRPTATVTTVTDQVVANSLAATIRFGRQPPSGIEFTPSVTVPQGFSGDTQWIQLVDSTRRRRKSDGVWQRWAGAGLDSVYPYWASGSTNDSPAISFSPSSNSGLTIIEMTVADSFEMYLMFKPSGTNSIWVPLRKVSWSWSAAGTYDGNTVTLGSSNHSTNPSGVDTTDHPAWTRNAQSNQWVNE